MLQQLMLQADGVVRLTDVEEPTPLPEFAFSPKAPKPITLSRHALCIQCEQPIHEKRGQRHHFYAPDDSGPYCPTCIGYIPEHIDIVDVSPDRETAWTHKPVRAVNPPGKADPDWDVALQGKPRFASIPLARSNRAPLGTAKPFIPTSFATREAEYNFLVATQNLEIATSEQELREAGIDAFRLGITNPDGVEPEVSDDERERAASRYGTAYDLPDPDVLRRIEWERWVSQCGASVRIHAERTDTGRTAVVDDARARKDTALQTFYRERFIAGMAGLAPQDEIESAREHVRHFRLRVLDYMTPEQREAWYLGDAKKAYLDGNAYLLESNEDALMTLPKREAIIGSGEEQVIIPIIDEPVHGPQEIGFHGTVLPMDFRSAIDYRVHISHDDHESEEPSEFELWEN